MIRETLKLAQMVLGRIWQGGPVDVAVPVPGAYEYRRLNRQIFQALLRHDMEVWFPRCVDLEHGGFLANYSRKWQPSATQSKALVFQSRLTWFAAQISEKVPCPQTEKFQGYARHGLQFLQQKLWDSQYGGFFWELQRDSTRRFDDPGNKHVYGISFGIYACAKGSRAFGDPASLGLARQAFRWLDHHAYDASRGGYQESLDRSGKPQLAGSHDQIGTPRGYKSANTHIHLLESFTELYRIWPDALLRVRLEELVRLVEETMFVSPGGLHQFYTSDFQPVPGLTSYGHDVEAAWLLIEAVGVLGRENERTWKIARALIDHALDHGFDGKLGGFFQQGLAGGSASDLRKVWWTQAEALLALLLMHERFGAESSRYWTAFVRTWQFIQFYQIDSRHGGWFTILQPDGRPESGAKGDNWKDPYHSGRALINISECLRRMAEPEGIG